MIIYNKKHYNQGTIIKKEIFTKNNKIAKLDGLSLEMFN